MVRHQGMAEWGLGQVQDVTGDGKVVVRFTGRPADVMLTAIGASAHLRKDSSEWQDVPRPKARSAAKSKAKGKTPAAE
ncbi:MAG: DUF3553 domain-containing protein [Vicinamibacterales bacterium]